VISRGITGTGFPPARRFVAEGASVFISGRRTDELKAAVKRIVKRIGSHVTSVSGDVAKLADLDRLYATVKQEKVHLDVPFANAGGGQFVPLGAITEAHSTRLWT
jgi:NAD(P)-dependent dehydrogenase (short-subunit alcohol dehydrogenase family)